MSENNAEVITLRDLLEKLQLMFLFLLKNWWKIGAVAFCGAMIGYLAFTLQKPRFDAACTFVLEERQSGVGGLGGLASQFGIDIGSITGGGGNGMFTGDNIFEILNSQIILKEVLLSKISTKTDSVSLADRYLEISKLKAAWAGIPKLDSIEFGTKKEIGELSVVEDSVLNIIYASIVKNNLAVERVSKKGTLIKTTVSSIDPEFSRHLVQRVVHGSHDYYINMKTFITKSNITRLQKKADSLLSLLTNRTYGAAQLQLNDPNPALRALMVPAELASRDKAVVATLYGEVVKNLEIARTTQMMQTPILQILDAPPLSLNDNKRGKLYWMAICVFISVALSSAYLILFKFNR
ncbi:hypothetical protein [Flavihumibacter sp. UBA7668]|uniref:hypothetical protein n=1 Tax=Flavihumibacter sp. UBA7668 TaxID=1946542 RepID=UPI0025B904CD|nr:hypothetical protein [Flavihumibacter sp. UBA7668]